MTLILWVAVLALLSMSWGSLFSAKDNLGALNVWIVDFDDALDPLVGPAIADLACALDAAPQPHITYSVRPAAAFDHDPLAVCRAIYDEKAWSAIVVHANATQLLRQAVATANASYDPQGACQTIYVEARDQVAIDSYILPALQAFQMQAVASVGRRWIPTTPNTTTTTTDVATIPPQVLLPTIGFTTINLRPFGPPVILPAVSVGLIYLIIISFFCYAFFVPIHMQFVVGPAARRRLYFHHHVLWRYLSTVRRLLPGLARVLAGQPGLSDSLYGGPGLRHRAAARRYRDHGIRPRVVCRLWMVNWIGMCALGLACENMAMIVGMPFTALWLIFWAITNVCTAFYPLELAAGFYRCGVFFPLHNVVAMTRVTLFDTSHQHVGRYVGVLTAWWLVNTAVFPLATWVAEWKMRPKASGPTTTQEGPHSKPTPEKDLERDGPS